MAAHRARVEAENRARYEALQLKVALQEREELRQRWGDLLPESLDVLRHLRMAYGIAVAEQVARAISAERDWAHHNQVEERNALVEALMLLGSKSTSRLLLPKTSIWNLDWKIGAPFVVMPALNGYAWQGMLPISRCRHRTDVENWRT